MYIYIDIYILYIYIVYCIYVYIYLLHRKFHPTSIKLWLDSTSSASLRSLMLFRNFAACTISAGPTMPGAGLRARTWDPNRGVYIYVYIYIVYIYIYLYRVYIYICLMCCFSVFLYFSNVRCFCSVSLLVVDVFSILFFVSFRGTWNQQTHGIASGVDQPRRDWIFMLWLHMQGCGWNFRMVLRTLYTLRIEIKI